MIKDAWQNMRGAVAMGVYPVKFCDFGGTEVNEKNYKILETFFQPGNPQSQNHP